MTQLWPLVLDLLPFDGWMSESRSNDAKLFTRIVPAEAVNHLQLPTSKTPLPSRNKAPRTVLGFLPSALNRSEVSSDAP